MRLGISSYTYGWAVAGDAATRGLSALALIDRAADLGVGVLQLCDNLPPETYGDAGVEAIASHAAARRISLELGTRGIAGDCLKRFIRIAMRLKSPIVRVVIDTPDDQPSPEQVIQRLSSILPELVTAGVILAIENHDRFPATTLVQIITALGSPRVGICLDTANSFGALEGPRVVVETLGPHVVNLHVKDFAVTRVPYLQGFAIEGRPAGEGMLDIPWLLAKLREFGRDPNAIVELWTPPEPTPAATIEKEAQWALRSVHTMRRYITD